MTAGARTLFISDLHLDDSRPGIVEGFERFLREVAPGAAALYILGDLFEYWVGDDSLALPFPARAAEALRAAARRHPVHFMHGNRDFMVAERFARETGLALLPDPTRIDLHGVPTLLLHGDTLCTGDVAYQRFRAQVRDPAWQRAALARPMEERLAIARSMRADSAEAKLGKTMGIMDVAPAAVEQAFRDSGCDVIIHGHTHRPARHVHVVDGRECVRWVLPDWYERGGYLEASPAGIRAVADF
ncbi:MAG TPA: UDP-2,3-diacylglucosamine diphosphatase [Usitatibacter sp.]|nr:UDP-2,3-diacylglucosamine diphosphatase [Usitatibacter sp.]